MAGTAGQSHVNAEGEAGVCHAEHGGCPYRGTDGGDGLGHSTTKAETEAACQGDASALAKAKCEVGAICAIGKERHEPQREGGRRQSTWEETTSCVWDNGAMSNPYDRSTSPVSNWKEDGVIVAKMDVTSLVLEYATGAK